MDAMASAFDPVRFLPDDLLARLRERAPVHDRDNTFPNDDLDDLRAVGYLGILAPEELGGAGLSLADAAVLQQRLAGAAPATALAVNMHLVWTGVAKVLRDRGIDDLEFVLRGAAAGEVFAFGISEAGNDLVLFGSDTDAAPDGHGGYRFTGTKIFTSLSPVWDHLGVHGLDTTSPDAPKMVFAFLDRDESIVARDDWNTMGMRGTQSRSTELRGAHARPDRVVRRLTRAPSPIRSCSASSRCSRSSWPPSTRASRASAGPRGRHGAGAPIEEDRGELRGRPRYRWRIADMALAYDALPRRSRR